MASGSAPKRLRLSLLVRPEGDAEDLRLSIEAKARHIERLTSLWATRDIYPHGSVEWKDATAEIIAVTKEVMRGAREFVVRQLQIPASHSSLANAIAPSSSLVPTHSAGITPNIALHRPRPASGTPVPLEPTDQTPPEVIMITAMREHSAALNNHAAALDRHTAAIEKQARDFDQNRASNSFIGTVG